MAALRRRFTFAPLVSILGLMSLGFMSGAAVMHFDLPPSGFFETVFSGAQAWFELRKAPLPLSPPGEVPPVQVRVASPDKTFDGFTLYTPKLGSLALLIDMHGQIVHKWQTALRDVWPERAQSQATRDNDSDFYFVSCHLYANGDLLAVCQPDDEQTPGYGLAKLDKDSKVVWARAANVHDAVDVGEDGTIYVMVHEALDEAPKGLEFISTPCLVDYLLLLSPEGKELNRISILEAFKGSPYRALLRSVGKESKDGLQARAAALGEENDRKDLLHTNSVKVLRRDLVPKFPLFRAGQVLLSIRHMNAVAVVDLEKRSVVWAAQGPWLAQHDAQFLDNGRLLIFDCLWSRKWSRVLEFDPLAGAVRWSFSGKDHDPFISVFGGMCQRLPNGNTLILDSDHGDIREVTPGKEMAWWCSCRTIVSFARRYDANQMDFLKGGQRARP